MTAIISVNGGSATESGLVQFTLSLSEPAIGQASVRYRLISQTAFEAEDFPATGIQTATIENGQTSGVITVDPNTFTSFEVDENFIIEIFDPVGARFADNAPVLRATGVIQDAESVSLFVSDPVVFETDGAREVEFEVQLSRAAPRDLRFNFTTAADTATAGEDFVPTSGVLDIASGLTRATVRVPVIGDARPEASETFSLVLTPDAASASVISNATSDSTGVATLIDDDTGGAAPRVLTIMPARSNESANLEFALILSEPAVGDVTVNFRTIGDTALQGIDYAAATGAVTIPSGSISTSLFIDQNTFTSGEIDESLTVEFFDPTNAVLAGGAPSVQVQGTIVEGADVSLFVNDPVLLESDDGTLAVFEVRLSRPSASQITLNYQTVDGSAVAGADYAAATGSLIFAPGQTLATVTVPILGDETPERAERFSLVLTPDVGSASLIGNGVRDSAGVATLLDDDADSFLPELSVLPAFNPETADLQFRYYLSEAAPGDVTFRVSTRDGTATAGNDFRGFTDVLVTVPAGVTTGIITVDTNTFTSGENDENLQIVLTNPTNAVFAGDADTLIVGGVVFDNFQTALFVEPAAVSETDGVAAFTVRLSQPLQQRLDLPFTTQDGSAQAGQDYVATAGTLTFLPGLTEATVLVPILTDAVSEGGEDFSLVVNVSGTTALANGAQAASNTATIRNIDPPDQINGTAAGEALTNDRTAIIRGLGGNDTIRGSEDADTLDGGAGRDLLLFDGAVGPVIARLDLGFSQETGADDDVLLNIENVRGGDFNDLLVGADGQQNFLIGGIGDDTLVGLSGDDGLEGGPGADRLEGGAGQNDVASYIQSSAGVTVRLWNGTGDGGDAQGDRLFGIEHLLGSAFADRLIGADGVDNALEGLGGADLLNGLSGVDTASYSQSNAGVTARLWNGTANGGHAEGDRLVSIENLTGSNFADRLIGSDGVGNLLEGGAGSDTLSGLSGADTLNGGVGADQLDGGAGVDTASYAFSGGGVVVQLFAGRGFGGEADGDRLIGIENLTGSRFGDRLFGADGVANLIEGGAGDDVMAGLSGADTLSGGAGADTADYSASGAAITARLWNGTGNGGHAEGDRLFGVENLIGSGFDDRLIGADGVANRLEGGAGADFLNGLSGVDTADYASSGAGVTVRLWNGTGQGGHAQGDRLTGIENLSGSGFADRLIGSDGVGNLLEGGDGGNLLEGGAGADTLNGLSGTDTLSGGNGVDTADYSVSGLGVTARLWNGTGDGGHAAGDRLFGIENLIGSRFDDRLIGADGVANLLEGGAGADFLNGLSGVDTADYSGSGAAVTVRLWNGTGEGGHAQGDRLASIENLSGSRFADRLIGSDGVANLLIGAGGADTLSGLSGGDTLRGGAGADRLDGGAGFDVADYSDSGAAVTARLWNGTADGGAAQGDRFVSIEGLSGSRFGDRLIGADIVANRLEGGAGDDILNGLSGADTLDGGAGLDTADYSGSGLGVLVSLSTGAGSGGHAEGDRLTGIENLTGSRFGDGLVGADGVANVLNGGGGADTLAGLSGADTLIGGGGPDTASYVSSGSAVTVNLNAGTGVGGHAQGDRLSQIENVLGSDFNDRLIGANGVANVLSGGAGDDTLDGLSGADTLIGGEGDDTFVFGRGSGATTISDFSTIDNDVIDLAGDLIFADLRLVDFGFNGGAIYEVRDSPNDRLLVEDVFSFQLNTTTDFI